MTLRCKHGDIAVIVHDTPDCRANIGRLVQVRGPLSTFNGMVTWRICPVTPELYWVTEHDGRVTRESVTWSSGVIHQDAWMEPIRPENPSESDEAQQDICRRPELALEEG